MDPNNFSMVSVKITQSNVMSCIISFDVNGGIGQRKYPNVSAVQGESMKNILPDAPSAPWYKVFDGWYTDSDRGTIYTKDMKVPNQESLVLYAHWKDKKCTIVFNGNEADSGTMMDRVATCNHYMTLPENAYKKNGYLFKCWNTKPDGSGKTLLGEIAINDLVDWTDPDGKMVTLYAQWEKEIRVKVTFDLGIDLIPQEMREKLHKEVIYHQRYGKLLSDVTSPNGLLLDGWETDDGKKVDEDTLVTIDKDHTLHARWRAAEYIIHFDGNGSKSGEMEDMVCKYGEKVKLPDCTFDDGDGFDCWGISSDGKGNTYGANAKVEAIIKDWNQKEITLYALWRSYDVEYYDGFSGELIKSVPKSEKKHKLTAIEAPEIEELEFVGWYSNPKDPGSPVVEKEYINYDALIKANETFVISEKMQLYPYYVPKNPNKVTVVYYLYPGIIKAEIFNRKPTIKITEDIPERYGFVFCGWSLNFPGGKDVGESLDNTGVYNSSVKVLYAIWGDPDQYPYIRYNLGYEGKEDVDSFSPKKLHATVKSAERPDYILTGWKTKDGKFYKVGDRIEVPLEGITLEAQWERKKYKIEYVDPKTNQILGSDILYSTDCISSVASPIAGMKIYEWRYYGARCYFVKPNGLVSSFVDTSSEKTTPYRLEAQFSIIDCGTDKGYILYNMNGGSGGPDKATIGVASEEIKICIDEPKRDNCVFDGWSTTPNGAVVFHPGDTINYYKYLSGNKALFLYAHWKSPFKFILDSNNCPNAATNRIEINAIPGTPIELKNYNFGKPKGYTLLGWGTTKDSISYFAEDTVVVPAKDCVLYAIWAADECTVYFVDDFSGQELKREKVQKGTVYTIPNNVAPEKSGYEFMGWSDINSVVEKNKIRDWVRKNNDVKYYSGSQITVDRDITLYPIYSDSPAETEAFTIRYNDNGGTGGPGKIVVAPGEYALSNQEPIREGYIFVGWDTDNKVPNHSVEAEYPKEKKNRIKGEKGEVITLYAVWRKNSSNELKYILEKKYGPDAIEDRFFDQPYESTDWEKINDKAYYVVRTWDKNDSYLRDALTSTVMLMEYSNGEWNFDAYGAYETPWKSVRMDILTAHTNSTAEALDCIFSVVDAAAEVAIAYFTLDGIYVVNGIHLLSKATEIMLESREYDDLKVFLNERLPYSLEEEIWDQFLNDFDGYAMGYIVKSVASAYKLDQDKEERFATLIHAAAKSLCEDLSSGQLDPCGEYDTAVGLFRDRVKEQLFNETIVSGIPNHIISIYLNAVK